MTRDEYVEMNFETTSVNNDVWRMRICRHHPIFAVDLVKDMTPEEQQAYCLAKLEQSI
jgi:hypothetical protein